MNLYFPLSVLRRQQHELKSSVDFGARLVRGMESLDLILVGLDGQEVRLTAPRLDVACSVALAFVFGVSMTNEKMVGVITPK